MKEVKSGTFKVKAKWSLETIEDLRILGIDAEAEITRALEEGLKNFKRLANKMPTVTDRMKPITVSLDKKRPK